MNCMKKNYTVLAALLFSSGLIAQQSSSNQVDVIYNDGFEISKPLRELAEKFPTKDEFDLSEMFESKDAEARRANPFVKSNENALPMGEDPARQNYQGNRASDAVTLVNWGGLSGSGYPPDPSGSAGPNHYVQAVNSSYKVYSKTGGSMSSTIALGTLLFGINDGDPIVMYDRYADRWFISEFGISGNKVYIAISQTPDPTGAYYKYSFTSAQFPDYLKFSIWNDGYYMSSNQSTQKMLVFERAEMLLGNPSARMLSKNFSPAPPSNGFFLPLPAEADGGLAPAGTPIPIFSYEDDGWASSSTDAIRVYKMATTWGTTPSATLTLDVQLPTSAFDASYSPSWNDIAQPGTTSKLDGIGGVLTFRVQWRKWTGYNSVVLCHAVKVNATTGQFGIRWYELRQDQSTLAWSIYQQSTYAPDVLNRWVGSIAMDENGAIGMAYAVSGVDGATNVYPSIRYTGRLASDPLNVMTVSEVNVVSGTGSQTSTNRFGDYSHTTTDPVNGSIFWHTGEYMGGSGTSGTPKTRIFSFTISSAVGINEALKDNNKFNVYQNGELLIVDGSDLSVDGDLVVDLFDVNGNLVEGKTAVSASGKINTSFNIAQLATGAYLIRIGKNQTSFQKVIKAMIKN